MGISYKKRVLLYLAILECIRNQKYYGTRGYQVHYLFQKRKQFGKYFTLIRRLELYSLKFFEYFRMSREEFNYILMKIDEHIRPKRTHVRKDFISSKEKLVLTLRYLATGASYTDLSFRFLMGQTTVRNCILQTIKAINKEFQSLVMPPPKSFYDWRKISEEFWSKWNFPNCLGAVDGKHVKMFAPRNSGSLSFNYKKTFSTILMAVAGPDYKFIMVSIGAHGSNSDSAVFSESKFGKAWNNYPDKLNVPADRALPGTDISIPNFLIGDEAFGLSYNLMTPYPGTGLTLKQRVFNYRISRARRLVESSFGILVHTWRILLKPLEVQMKTAKELILTCCILHNFIKMDINDIITDMAEIESTPSELDVTDTVVNHSSKMNEPISNAIKFRNQLSDWCTKEGNLEYQYKRI